MAVNIGLGLASLVRLGASTTTLVSFANDLDGYLIAPRLEVEAGAIYSDRAGTTVQNAEPKQALPRPRRRWCASAS